jgi:hypothetical protein
MWLVARERPPGGAMVARSDYKALNWRDVLAIW